jgi:adenosylcobinamide kinase/adenosylcobinamide-phosphate guanylyltransferase
VPDKRKIILLLGGARSGKSTFAQKLAGQLGKKVIFVATGEPLDEEMKTRIDEHKKNRPESWRTLEAPLQVGRALKAAKAHDAQVVIIDCITLLISNLLENEISAGEAEIRVAAEMNELISVITTMPAHCIIVSNEVGLGLVPDNFIGRIYRDLLGKTNQTLAHHASEVYFLTAGIPLKIKSE